MTRDALLRRGWTLPLLLSLFVDNVRGTPIRTAALLAAVLWSAAVLVRFRRAPRFPLPLVLLLLWCAAGLCFSAYRDGTLSELSLLAGAAALWAGARVLWEAAPEERAFFSRAVVVLGLVKAATALAGVGPGGRAVLEPAITGTANTSLMPMFLVLGVVLGRAERAPLWRGLWGLLLACAVWFCVRWNAMAALLGLAAGIPLVFSFQRRSAGLLWGAVAGATVALGIFLSPFSPRWLQYNPGNPDRFERLVIWRDSFSLARAHWLTGTALGTFEQHYPAFKSLPDLKTANHAHNDWLQLLCEAGLPGFLLAGLLLLRGGRLLRREGGAAPGPAAGLVLLALWACVYFPFRSDALLFSGALMLALLSPGPSEPLRRGVSAALAAAGLLTVSAALLQGAGQSVERWGGAAWDAGDAAEALGRFRAAARVDPWEPRYLLHQVECLRRLDRKAETLPLLEKALALKPRDIWTRRKLAVARLHLEGPEAARETYGPILSLAPRVDQFRREYEELAAAKR